jgi:phosphatidylglycerophosphate synthase
MPLLITLLPLIGLGFLASEPVEWALVATSATLGVSSLRLGFREHGKRRALAVLAVGLTLLIVGRVSESRDWGAWGVPALVLGGCTVALSHVFNGRLCRSCRTCSSGGCGVKR